MSPRRLLTSILLTCALPTFAAHVPIDVGIQKSGPAFAPAGSRITYTITLTTLFPGYAYAVTDQLPAGLRFVSAGGPLWNCIESNGKVTCGNERLDDSTSSFTIVADGPARPQTIVNTATVVSVSALDPNTDNNTASFTTVFYDADACAPRSVQAIEPANHATVTGPHVTLRWSAVPNAVRYEVSASEGSTVMRPIGTTSDTQLAADFTPGEVGWTVSAVTSDCPVADMPPQTFTVAVAPVTQGGRRRAVAHP
jgi:uncharacterized repeat protein (TIGR01451 family)